MTMEQDASLRRLSGLVSRYISLGEHLQKCRDLMPQASPTLIDISRVVAIAHQEMKSFEVAMADLIDDSIGFVRLVKESPEATERWWKKYHNTHCLGEPVYRAGFGPRSTLTGQQLHREPLD